MNKAIRSRASCVAVVATFTTLILQLQACRGDCLPPPSGLVGWWPGDGSAIDLVSSNVGTINGGVSFTNGVVGQAFNFNGSNSFVELQNNQALTPLGSFSIEAWVNPATTTPGIILDKWGDQNQESYAFETKPNGVYNFAITDAAHQQDAAFHSFTTGVGSVIPGQWTHLAAVYDQSTGTRTIYINGVLAAQRTDPPITILPGLGRPAIGADLSSVGGSSPPQAFFNGSIDELTVYNRALSASEVAAIYNAGSSGKCYGPFITSEPASQLVAYGLPVSFSVGGSGAEPLGYQWFAGGAAIAGATSNTLAFANAYLTNTIFTAVVTNVYGSVTSTPAVLTINPVGTSVALYAGVTINGGIGFTYGIQGSSNLSDTNSWRGLTNMS